jgi:hypothetical protein
MKFAEPLRKFREGDRGRWDQITEAHAAAFDRLSA